MPRKRRSTAATNSPRKKSKTNGSSMADDGEPNNYIGVDLQAEPSNNLLPSQQPASSNTLSTTQMAEVVSAVVSELSSRGMIVTEKQNDIPVAQPARDNADLGVIENSVRNVLGLQNQDEPVLHVSGENPSTSAEARSPVQLPKGSISVLTNAVTNPSQIATESSSDLNSSALHVMSHALVNRTKQSYFSYWKKFVQFCIKNDVIVTLPVQSPVFINFLAHLYDSGFRVSTIHSVVSALSYIHKAMGLPDLSGSFLLKQFLKGAHNLSTYTADTRLPITFSILSKIIMALPHTILLLNERIMFAAMCNLAFHGFLRIGEFCMKSKTAESQIIHRSDVKMIYEEGEVIGLELTIRKFKHSVEPVSLFIPQNKNNALMCPLQSMQKFFEISNHFDGPLFQLPNGKIATYSFFNSHLANTIKFLGFNPQLYKSHSFRIGAATYASMKGFSDDAIMKMGRWKSHAVKKYIRLPNLSLKYHV